MTNANIWLLPSVAGAVGLAMLIIPLTLAAIANDREMAVLRAWIASLVRPASYDDQGQESADGQAAPATPIGQDRRFTTGRPDTR
jgi:hypothetical protein